MKRFEKSVTIQATPEQIWDVMTNFEAWPNWNDAVSSVTNLSLDTAGRGARVRIKQPKLRAAEWTVTDWQPSRAFTWESRSMGIMNRAFHEIVPTEGGAIVSIGVEMDGPLASIVGSLGKNTIVSYLGMEADGLKRQSELGPS